MLRMHQESVCVAHLELSKMNSQRRGFYVIFPAFVFVDLVSAVCDFIIVITELVVKLRAVETKVFSLYWGAGIFECGSFCLYASSRAFPSLPFPSVFFA